MEERQLVCYPRSGTFPLETKQCLWRSKTFYYLFKHCWRQASICRFLECVCVFSNLLVNAFVIVF